MPPLAHHTTLAHTKRLRLSKGQRASIVAESETRHLLSRLVWVCLWILLIPEFIPPLQEIFSGLRINLPVRLIGFAGALILTRPILADWTICWPFLFVFCTAFFSTVLNRFVGNQWGGGTGSVYPAATGLAIDNEWEGLTASVYPTITAAAIYLMVIATVTNRRRFVLFSIFMIAAALVTSGILVWENVTSDRSISSSGQMDVARGILENQNWLATFILGGLSSCFCLLELYSQGWRWKLLIVLVVGLYLSSFFTGSRGTVVAATFLVGLWFVATKSRQRALGILALTLILGLLWSIQSLDVVSYTFGRLSGTNAEEVVEETRYDLIVDALDIWRENILFGAGWGAVLEKTEHAAHMTITGLLAETGVIGLVLFYLPVLVIMGRGFHLSKSKSRQNTTYHGVLRVLVIGLMGFLVHGLFNETYFNKSFYINLGLLVGIMQANRLRPWPLKATLLRDDKRRHSIDPNPLSPNRPF